MPPTLDLYGLNVATAVAPDSPILAVSQLRARLSLWSLVLGKVRLAFIEFNDMAVIWPPPGNFPGFLRDTGAPQKPEPKGEGSSWPPDFDLPVDRIYLRNAKAFVRSADVSDSRTGALSGDVL